MPEYELFEDRLIAFFDILGFTTLLHQKTLDELYNEYSIVIDDVSNTVLFEQDKTGTNNFAKSEFLSDSIVLVSHPLNATNIGKFIFGCIRIMSIFFSKSLPLRGAISRGDFLNDEKRRIFLSRAFTDSVKLEGQQEWSGCVIDDSAEAIIIDNLLGSKYLDDLNFFNPQTPVLRYHVPLKEISSKNMLCLNWVQLMVTTDIQRGIDFLTGIKHVNTSNFANRILHHPQRNIPIDEPNCNVSILRAMSSRITMTFQFLTNDEELVNPPNGFEMKATTGSNPKITIKLK